MTIDFIPLYLYTSIYWFVFLLTATFTMIRFSATEQDASSSVSYGTGYLLVAFSLIYIGLRPTSPVFVDMNTYAKAFDLAQRGAESSLSPDIGFEIFLKLSANLVSQRTFFFLCSLLYIAPIVFACRRWSPTYWPFLLVAFLGSFSFWAYGVNGILNGIATSFLLFAFSMATLWPRLMGGADVMLLPSFHEGFPVVLVESQTVGLPAIISDKVAPEVDLGIGLVSVSPIESGVADWCKKIVRVTRNQSAPIQANHAEIRRLGFDVITNTRLLEDIYRE